MDGMKKNHKSKILNGWLDDPTIVIDFDDTICEGKGLEYGKPKRGVIEALEKIRKKGYKIIIHSVRSASYWKREGKDPKYQTELILEYLDSFHIPYDYIFTGNKPLALYYIDDKAIRFQDNWSEIAESIKKPSLREIKPWSGWRWKVDD